LRRDAFFSSTCGFPDRATAHRAAEGIGVAVDIAGYEKLMEQAKSTCRSDLEAGPKLGDTPMLLSQLLQASSKMNG
jgi:hypothetical protein